MLLAVNFHYVAAVAPAAPRAIFPVSTQQLGSQLDELGRQFELVSRDDVLDAVRGEAELPARACLVTFDDGLREQFELALPELDRRGVPAVFFVPGLPLAERRALHVHKLHALRERIADVELAAELEREGVFVADIPEDEARAHYRYDDLLAARLKLLLNARLALERRERLVDVLFGRLVGDEPGFCAGLYMEETQVRELEARYRAVGGHSYAHRPLALLDAEARRRDLRANAEALERVTGARVEAFSYPNGTPSTVDRASADGVAAAGFRIAFTMERAVNATLDDPLLLARLDTNDAPGGRRPLLEVDGGGLRASEGVTLARTRYLDEAVMSRG